MTSPRGLGGTGERRPVRADNNNDASRPLSQSKLGLTSLMVCTLPRELFGETEYSLTQNPPPNSRYSAM
eukprot:1188552-Prorocentrum_minimum.AAC.4